MTMNLRHFGAVILLLGACLLAPAGKAVPAPVPAQAPDFDLLIKGGTVYDGLGNPGVQADVAVKDGVIVLVTGTISGSAGRVIDAAGLTVTPGFIDMHTHADQEMLFPESRASLSYLRQGVTTIVAGQCGQSPWPDFEQAADLIRRWTVEGIGPNAALLVGHGSVRQLVMGLDNREPTPAELAAMKTLVRKAMDQGACGLSTGLIYTPGFFAKTPEVVELVKVVAPYNGIYHSHVRNERETVLQAMREHVSITEQAGVRSHVSHIKVMGPKNWGLSKDIAAVIEEARGRGLKITADQYPYPYSNTSPYRTPLAAVWVGAEDRARSLAAADFERLLAPLGIREIIELYAKATAFVPLSLGHRAFLESLPRRRLIARTAGLIWSRASGPENERERAMFLARLGRPAEAAAIRETVRRAVDAVGAENWIVGMCADRSLVGKSFREIAALRNIPVEDAAIELELMGALSIPVSMSEADIEFLMKKDWVATGSDGITPVYGIGTPHIRSYSTFLHKIKEYALRREVLTLAQAIRSQTSLPAEIMNWPDRGRIAPGCKADIVVLDLQGLECPADITNPHQYARGVKHLLINGTTVLDDGRYTGALPGKVIRLKP
jgi:N-acyl-D-amino-acid deacylase